ncbi:MULTISPECIES: 2-oxo acid dehydrogenase subunit E2 [Cryobacterium]|uniref:2-oxo acid dehydrogenase subunit E2 n=1 Tax=Cryobacterium serini TaxID=1259201 RepID=A0A4R9BIV5_9MICO|nr:MULTISPECIES: 2-oxo acid dehydrogenase subunit E2 [Cryobacterium]TFD85246.1 2-oxo acid dehydrogenase subunit E2 [Cryobacterium serini]
MTQPLELDEGQRTELKGMRRTAARRMVVAWEAPVFHLTVEVDMTEASRAKEVVSGATVTDVLVRATAHALTSVPEVNVHVDGEAVVSFQRAHVGIAVATEKGLTVPIIHNADQLDLEEIALRRRDIVGRARTGGLGREDITGGTFTISNLGMLGVTRFDAIVNAPQAAILAVGATIRRNVWTEDGGAWRPIAELTLTSDHRALDGAVAARFLAALKSELEAPL